MNESKSGPTLPIPTVAEVLFDISLMRGECVSAAGKLMARRPVDEVALEQCALLDDALAVAQAALTAGLQNVQRVRAGQAT
jgi:hypothetical protein